MAEKQEITINFPKLKDLINTTYIPLWDNENRYIIHYGSRGSAKSDYTAVRIIYKMMNDKYFKGIAIRNTFESLKESCYDTILKVIQRFGLKKFFKCTTSPLKIVCLNGNMLLFRGMDNPSKIKSISDPNFAWFEEEIPDSQEAWETVSTTLRSSKAPYIQEVFTINPVIPNYKENWFYKMFFEGEDELNFEKVFEFTNLEGKTFKQSASIHHSSFKDNRWLDHNAVAKIELMALGDPYLYQVYNLGVWADKAIDGRFYMSFNVVKNVDKIEYDPSLALHIGFDFNVRPFSAATVCQIVGKKIYVIDEICVADINESPIKATCLEILKRYETHDAGMFIYGDATGIRDNSTNERGHNNYTIIFETLKKYRAGRRVPLANPSVVMRGNFMNELFMKGYEDIELIIGSNCVHTINDLLYLRVDNDGTIKKEMIKDKKDGIAYERYGHLSDSLGYLVIECYRAEYERFKNGGAIFTPVLTKRTNKHQY